jgi:hypothetical protein
MAASPNLISSTICAYPWPARPFVLHYVTFHGPTWGREVRSASVCHDGAKLGLAERAGSWWRTAWRFNPRRRYAIWSRGRSLLLQVTASLLPSACVSPECPNSSTAAIRRHDLSNNRPVNLKASAQQCHMLHDRPIILCDVGLRACRSGRDRSDYVLYWTVARCTGESPSSRWSKFSVGPVHPAQFSRINNPTPLEIYPGCLPGWSVVR